MLRPATPLTILLLISFVLLLLSVISTPVVKSIPIATYQGVNFGVFGYCTTSQCSGIRVGYTTDGLFGPGGDGDFNLPSSARHSLSSLLIVHPVAAFCNLVCLALAAAAHLHSPSHSARYLLGLLILLLPTLLVTLLAFLVDILLFVPHLQWGGWIVLASTILITASGVVTCAMRRTLVSRKARKKRIAENAEMSGENYYSRQAQESKAGAQTFTTEPTVPMVNGAPGADRLPAFATFNPASKTDEDLQPLRSQALSDDPTLVPSRDGASEKYYGPPSRSNSRPPPDDRRDAFPSAPPPGAVGGPPMPMQGRRPGDGYPPPGPYRDGSMPPPGSRGYGSRGRGGYPPRGAMMDGGQRRPPPGYPPNGRDGSSSGYIPPEEYSDPNGRHPTIAASQPFIEGGDRRFDVASPSIYTTGPDDRQGPYGARAQYVPPRAQWNNMPRDDYAQPIPSGRYGPVELPTGGSQAAGYGGHNRRPRVNSGGSEAYYEDVNPRFAADPEPMPPMPVMPPNSDQAHVPPLLTPGQAGHQRPDSLGPLPQTNSYEDLPGARSPAESETSNFTSVSQRGVNPNWRPGAGGEFGSFGPPSRRRDQQMKRDVLLEGNPDFELPGMNLPARPIGRGRGGGGPGMRGGGMTMLGTSRIPPASAVGAGADGRYPLATPPPPGPGGMPVREI
ncbi:hypothetical protein A1O1_00397 [Capronia coronata CBS 617.96]|uniref:PH-response regulator protein palI/RIM9 n=1 Tax=Capronia coronata CBS 617.96 TaxID=1182541 RepID=W9YQU1_9EURO|nr:uncharacterized protein A1O1_00397 [Capronia coronata CBS 617.96]EXJ95277.1 hypothetical protein A1O1_00397 [Capronia coronata CBS 617.96]